MKDMMVKEIEELSKAKKINTPDLFAEAVKIGLNRLWQEMVLARYISKKISRREAIRFAGLDNVRTAEKQKKIVLEDIKWGWQHA